MGCDFYICKYLIIDYIDKDGNTKEYDVRLERHSSYLSDWDYLLNDVDSDEEIDDNKLEQAAAANPDKILCQNNNWIKDSYKHNLKYFDFLNIKHVIKLVKGTVCEPR